MHVTTLAAWGEFLGGVAAVGSLFYLVGQIRQNSKLLRAPTASVSGETNSRVPILAVQDPEVAWVDWGGWPIEARFPRMIGGASIRS